MEGTTIAAPIAPEPESLATVTAAAVVKMYGKLSYVFVARQIVAAEGDMKDRWSEIWDALPTP